MVVYLPSAKVTLDDHKEFLMLTKLTAKAMYTHGLLGTCVVIPTSTILIIPVKHSPRLPSLTRLDPDAQSTTFNLASTPDKTRTQFITNKLILDLSFV